MHLVIRIQERRCIKLTMKPNNTNQALTMYFQDNMTLIDYRILP